MRMLMNDSTWERMEAFIALENHDDYNIDWHINELISHYSEILACKGEEPNG